jgi:TolB-like protein/DNA-binding winged helix-turn-helix (wHTH) protein/Tfp pilus assembly protein PilF
MASKTIHFYKFGNFVLHPGEYSLKKNGQQIRLRPKAFEILLYLIERPGLLVRKDDLLNNVWPDVIVAENTLSHCIDDVRQALGDNAREPLFIETMPRLGFKFIADVENIDSESTETGSISEKKRNQFTEPTNTLPKKIVLRRTIISLLIISFVLLLGSWAMKFIFNSQPKTDSIVVLPLVNMSGDPEQEYFADGMTEALTASLSRISNLRVISRTSAMSYKHTGKSLPQIAGELNVDMAIEGSVLRDSNRVRIIVQLIQARNDKHQWAGTFEKEVGDILVLQNEMARAIAEELQVKLKTRETDAMAVSHSITPTAYDAYLKGRYFLAQRTLIGLEKSIEFFEQAIEIDPGYTEAYAGNAKAHIILSLMGEYPATLYMARAAEMCNRALQMDSTLAEAHTMLAYVKMHYYWDWPGADREFKRAMRLNPNYATTYHFYAMYLATQGYYKEAIASIQKALQLDPFSPIINTHHAWFYYVQGNYDEAIVYFKKTLAQFPYFSFARFWLGMVYLDKSMPEQAEACFKEEFSQWPGSPRMLGLLGFVYASEGKKTKASEVLNRLIRMSEQRYVSGLDIAGIYLSLGDRERAFQWLEKAWQDREPMLIMLKVTPIYAPLRSDPRYNKLLKKVGLTP